MKTPTTDTPTIRFAQLKPNKKSLNQKRKKMHFSQFKTLKQKFRFQKRRTSATHKWTDKGHSLSIRIFGMAKQNYEGIDPKKVSYQAGRIIKWTKTVLNQKSYDRANTGCFKNFLLE